MDLGFVVGRFTEKRASSAGARGSAVGLTALLCLLAGAGTSHAATDDALIGAVSDGTAPTQYSGFEAKVMCPGKRQALGGGILQSGPPDDLVLRASGPLDKTGKMRKTRTGDKPVGWYAAATNETTTSKSFRVYVVCAKARVTVRAKRFEMPTGEAKKKSVGCPGTKRAVGGGVLPSGSYGGSFVKQDGPTDSSGSYRRTREGDIPKRWLAAMQNQGGSEFFKVLAVCARGSHAKLQVATGEVDGADKSDETYTPCPAGKRALGGGVLQNRAPDQAFSVVPTGPLDDTSTTFGTGVGDKPVQWYGGLNSISSGAAKFKVAAICE